MSTLHLQNLLPQSLAALDLAHGTQILSWMRDIVHETRSNLAGF